MNVSILFPGRLSRDGAVVVEDLLAYITHRQCSVHTFRTVVLFDCLRYTKKWIFAPQVRFDTVSCCIMLVRGVFLPTAPQSVCTQNKPGELPACLPYKLQLPRAIAISTTLLNRATVLYRHLKCTSSPDLPDLYLHLVRPFC